MAKPTYYGREFDSPEELELFWWLEEAKDNGLITDFSCQQPTFHLADSVIDETPQFGKRGQPIKCKTRTLLQAVSYTCDFHVLGGRGLIPEHVDVKGGYTRHDSEAAKFQVIRKWVYQRHQVLVYPIVPIKLFKDTWAPAEALITPKTRQKTNKKAYKGMKTIKQYLDER